MNNQFDAPCSKSCPDRCPDPNCHMTCERYLEFRAFLDKKSKEEYEEIKDYMSVNHHSKAKY